MILVLNVGNTNINMGIYINKQLRLTSSISTMVSCTTDEMAINLKNVFSLYHLDPIHIEGAIIASVAQISIALLSDAIKLLCGKAPLVVGPGIKTGLDILIDNPAELGSDIVVASVAAISKFSKPIIVIILGTATIMCVINEKGRYIGGVLIPGAQLALDALSLKAAQLPRVSIRKPKKLIGSNSIDCMESGSFYGTVAMIDGMVNKIEKELGQKCNTIITGELAEEIKDFLTSEITYEKNLLIEGLFLIYNKNVKN